MTPERLIEIMLQLGRIALMVLTVTSGPVFAAVSIRPSLWPWLGVPFLVALWIGGTLICGAAMLDVREMDRKDREGGKR